MRSRRVAALLALWAILLQVALSAFHHHDHLGDHHTVQAAVGAAAGSSTPAGDGDDDDGDGCAVCQILLALQAFTSPLTFGGPPAPVAVALLRLTQSSPRPPRHHRRRHRRQPRAPPAAR